MINIEKFRSAADKIFSILVFTMAVVFFFSSFSLPTAAALLPRWVALLTAGLIAPVVARQWKRKPAQAGDGAKHTEVEVPVYQTALFLIAYTAGIYVLGYMVASALFSIAISKKMGLKSWIVTILLALVLAGGTTYIFGTVFGIRVPAGLLFENLF